MRRLISLAPVLPALLLLAACGGGSSEVTHVTPTTSTGPTTTTASITVTSSAYAAGAAIPVKYSCDGDRISPPIAWTAVPAAQEYRLRMDDPDAPGGTFVHWVLLRIPASVTRVDEGALPVGVDVVQPYRGPCPPKGSTLHHYVVTVSAYDGGGGLLGRGTLTGTYLRH
jgi:hypothetical protein